MPRRRDALQAGPQVSGGTGALELPDHIHVLVGNL